METLPNVAMGDCPESKDKHDCINCGNRDCDGNFLMNGCINWMPIKWNHISKTENQHKTVGGNVQKS